MHDVYEVRNKFLRGGVRCQNTWHFELIGASSSNPHEDANGASAAWTTRFLFDWFLQFPRHGIWTSQRTRRLNNGGGPWATWARNVLANPFITDAADSRCAVVMVWQFKTPAGWSEKRLFVPGVGRAGTVENRVSGFQVGVLTDMIHNSFTPFSSFGKTWQFTCWSRKYQQAFHPVAGYVFPYVAPLNSRAFNAMRATKVV